MQEQTLGKLGIFLWFFSKLLIFIVLIRTNLKVLNVVLVIKNCNTN